MAWRMETTQYYKRVEHDDEIRQAKESLSREHFIEVVVSKDLTSSNLMSNATGPCVHR